MDFVLSFGNCELKTSPIVIGSLVAHIYNPGDMWVAADVNANQNDKILWRSGEIGLVLRVDVWGESPDIDILISVMISAGIGYCFGSDVNTI